MNFSNPISKVKSAKKTEDKLDANKLKKKVDTKKVKSKLDPKAIKAKLSLKEGEADEVKGTESFKAGTFSLKTGESIDTKNRRLIMQGDGNLVLYKLDNGKVLKPLWASNTNHGSDYNAVFQGDGNLVVYDGSGRAKWASGTNPRGNRLIMQADGNLVIYSDIGKALWATGTQ